MGKKEASKLSKNSCQAAAAGVTAVILIIGNATFYTSTAAGAAFYMHLLCFQESETALSFTLSIVLD